MQGCRPARYNRVLAGAAALLAAALSISVVHPSAVRADPPTGGTTIVSETFENGTVPDTGWAAQGITCLTGAAASTPSPNIPNCSGARNGPVPAMGALPGYLQLTDTRTNGVGSIFYNRPIPAAAGISVTFEQYQYGGTGADGIGFFLVDGATNLTQTGANGGSLGYAQKTNPNTAGVLGGYVGVGLDAFGNFYDDAEGRGTNCPQGQRSPSTASGAVAPNVITVRGPGSGLDGYCYQGSTTDPASNPDKPTSTLHGTLRQSGITSNTQVPTARRTVNVQVTPAPNPMIIVQVNYGSGWVTELEVPAPPGAPSTYKFGFSASTGGSTDVHLIRDVNVSTIVPLNALQLVKQVDRTQAALPAVITAGTTIPYQYVVTNAGTQTVHGLSVTDDKVSGITCAATTLPPAPAAGATTTCTGSYVVTAADVAAGSVTNTAAAAALDPSAATVTSNQAQATVPLVSRLSLSKSVTTAGPYVVGQQISYSYGVTNTGGSTVSSVAVTDDRVPAGGVTCAQSSLDPGASTTCTATTTIQSGQLASDGTLTNTATATGVTPIGQQVTSNTARATIDVGTDIGVTKTVDDHTPAVGSNLTFTITTTNHGPGIGSGAVINDRLPAGLALVSATPSQGTYNSSTGNWSVGTLQVGQTETLVIVATVNTTAALTNAATLTALNQPDTNSANNTDSVTVNPVVPTTDIAVTKSVADAAIRVGQETTFTITATNNGPFAATGVTLIDAIPDGLTFVSTDGNYDPGTAIWTVGSVAVNQTKTLRITVRASQTGTYENTAGLRDVSPMDINQANNVDTATLRVTPKEADLQVVKNIVSGTDNIQVGDDVTYSLTITNAGPDDVPDAVVTDTPVPGLTVQSTNPSQGTVDVTSLTWNVGALATGHDATIVVVVRVDTAGTKDNLATGSSATVEDPDLSNNTSEATFSASPDKLNISVDKSVDDASPSLGSDVTFTVTTTNHGPSDATGLVLGDALPAGLSFVSANPSVGSYDHDSGVWDVGDLAAGDDATLTVVARADELGTAVNTAALRSVDQADTDPDDNSASVIVDVTERADLQLVKSVSPTVARPGQVVTYTVTITNNGPNTADSIQAVDPVQVQVHVIGSHASQGSFDAHRLEWDVGTLTTGSAATLTVRVRADLVGTFLNTAVISHSGQFDPDLSNNRDTATLQVPAADLAVSKTVDDAAPQVGDTIRFTISATNNGPDRATGVRVRDRLPVGLSYVSSNATKGSYDAATGVWTIGTMVPAAGETLTIRTRVTAPGNHANTATIGSGSPDNPDPSNNTSTVHVKASPQPADVSVAKTVNAQQVTVGALATFTITAHNRGPATASSVIVRDKVPQGLRIESVAPSACSVTGRTVTCAFGDLAPGVSDRATVHVSATVAGRYRNHARATTTARDPDPGNNVATARLEVTAAAGTGPGSGPPGSGTRPPGPPLASTGTDVRDLCGIGALLLVCGGLVLLVSRGRTRGPAADRHAADRVIKE